MIQPVGAALVVAATRQAIEQLVAEHAWLIDHGQADQIALLYTDDARVLGIGPDKIGQAAIQTWAAERAAMTERRSRHVQSNLRLAPVSGDECRGTVVLTLYRHDGPGKAAAVPLMIGEYEDAYRRGPDGTWRFAERRLSVLFGG